MSVKVNHQAALRGIKPPGYSGSLEPHISLRRLHKASKWCSMLLMYIWGWVRRSSVSHWTAMRHTLTPSQGRIVCSAGRPKGTTFALKLWALEGLAGGISDHYFLLSVVELTKYTQVESYEVGHMENLGKQGAYVLVSRISSLFYFILILTCYMCKFKSKWRSFCGKMYIFSYIENIENKNP